MNATPCPRCFTPLPSDAQFCGACGNPAPRPAHDGAGPGYDYAAGQAAAPGYASSHAAAAAPVSWQPLEPMRPPEPISPPAPPELPSVEAVGPEPARAAQPHGMRGEVLPVCRGCGTVAPRERSTCAVCELDLPAGAVPTPRTFADDYYWVAVRCEFQCRMCGHMSPLNHLDMDGSVVCLHCGLNQAFDVDLWTEGLEHAHGAGDLSGPDDRALPPDGQRRPVRDNPFEAVGRSHTTATLQLGGMSFAEGMMRMRSLHVSASPGHPLCPQCRAPLRVTGMHGAEMTVQCPSCGQQTGYQTPAAGFSACAALRGVIADEHRADSREGQVEQSEGGAIAIRCPNCSAGVSISGRSTIVDCQYCHVALRIPSNAMFKLGHDKPEPLLWWLLFQGISDKRRELEYGQRQSDIERRKSGRDKGERRSSERHIEKRQLAERGRGAAVFQIALPVAVVALVGLAGYRDRVQAWLDRDAEVATASGASNAAGVAGKGARGARADALPDRSQFLTLEGCGCTGAVGGREVRAQLAVHIREGQQMGERAAIDLTYYLDLGDDSRLLAVADDAAPPPQIGERTLGIGVACRKGVIAIAAGKRVTGWSLADAKRVWTRELAAPYRYRAKPVDGGVSIQCAAMRIESGHVRVPIGRKGRAKVDMATGKLRK